MQLFFRISRTLLILCLLPIFIVACTGEPESTTKTIGVLSIASSMDSVLEGFKDEMTSLGYVEGEDIVYVYGGAAGTLDNLDSLVADLKTHDLDLILTFGTPPSQKAKAAFADAQIPIVFGPVTDAIAGGLVTSFVDHSENITGIQNGTAAAKGVEWLAKTFPDIEQVYVPHKPDDASSNAALTTIQEVAPDLGIELIIREVTTDDDLTAALADIPEETDAVIAMPVTLFDARYTDFVLATNQPGIPILIARSDVLESTGATIGYGPDFFSIGKQMAHLGDQILKGSKASDLPVELSESFLSVNLKAAKSISMEIPQVVLEQADEIVR